MLERVARRAPPDKIGDGGGPVDADTERAIRRARGGGRRLDSGTRERMEGAFGADFSAVRLHTGEQATTLNDRIHAGAFTVGQDVFLREPLPPGDAAGERLLVHELAHTLQSGEGGRIRRGPGKNGTGEKGTGKKGDEDKGGDDKGQGRARTTSTTMPDREGTAPQGGQPADEWTGMWWYTPNFLRPYWPFSSTPTPTNPQPSTTIIEEKEKKERQPEHEDEKKPATKREKAVEKESSPKKGASSEEKKAQQKTVQPVKTKPDVPPFSTVQSTAITTAKDGEELVTRAKAGQIDTGELEKALAKLAKSGPTYTQKSDKAKTNERQRWWAATQETLAQMAPVRVLLDAAIEVEWKKYDAAADTVLPAARTAVEKATAARVDCTALTTLLQLHNPADEGVPDYAALTLGLPAVTKETTTVNAALVAPMRWSNDSPKVLAAAEDAKKKADAALDGDSAHPRDSAYWEALRTRLGWLESRLAGIQQRLTAKLPDWPKLVEDLDYLQKYSIGWVLREIDNAPGRAEKRVGRNDVAIDVRNPDTIKGDGIKGEQDDLRETLHCISTKKRWTGLGNGAWGAEHGDYGRHLPEGTYVEYYVRPPPGTAQHLDGLRRVVVGDDRRRWYTWTHYGDKGKPAFVLLKGYGGV